MKEKTDPDRKPPQERGRGHAPVFRRPPAGNEAQTMKLNHIWGHFKTITTHKWLVMKNCFRIGLYRQGLLHDLSKYGWTEFSTGVRYYQGNRSPNAAEREEKGYSAAWLHHKGRNRHHLEYWMDVSPKGKEAGMVGVKMPLNYVMEMMMDRIAASKVYRGKDYRDGWSWEYSSRRKEYVLMHPETRALVERLLLMLRDEGEEKTFAEIRALLKKGSY